MSKQMFRSGGKVFQVKGVVNFCLRLRMMGEWDGGANVLFLGFLLLLTSVYLLTCPFSILLSVLGT